MQNETTSTQVAGAATSVTVAPGVIPAAIGAAFGGGVYAGILRGGDGAADYHLVLLEGDAGDLSWAAAQEFAAGLGGDLPTRREQRLLFINLKDQFEEEWYWSGEQHASDPSNAWLQLFYDGYQTCYHKSDEGRARAVRRLPIQ